MVLGGESGQRVIGAAELYHRGVAPRVFVSGEGDCKLIVNRLVMAGVPAPRIAYECVSRNTFQNAEQTRVSLQAFQPAGAAGDLLVPFRARLDHFPPGVAGSGLGHAFRLSRQ